MISHELKCIFLHPNKCGGKSIEKAIWNKEPQSNSADHRQASQYIQEYGQDIWNNYYKFGFSRNPWDRLVSIYHGRKQLVKKKTISATFEEWIISDDLKVHPQRLWLTDDLDFIGRFENYNEDFEIVKNKLKLNVELPHVNASKHKHYTKYYDDNTKEMVYNLFKDDIIAFGYEFGE